MKRPAPKDEPGPSCSKRSAWTVIPRNDSSSSESESEDEKYRVLGGVDSEDYDSEESDISDLIDNDDERYTFIRQSFHKVTNN